MFFAALAAAWPLWLFLTILLIVDRRYDMRTHQPTTEDRSYAVWLRAYGRAQDEKRRRNQLACRSPRTVDPDRVAEDRRRQSVA